MTFQVHYKIPCPLDPLTIEVGEESLGNCDYEYRFVCDSTGKVLLQSNEGFGSCGSAMREALNLCHRDDFDLCSQK